MKKFVPPNPVDFVVPLNMNGMQGRMLHLPPPEGKNKEILLVYGHHASIERMFGFAQALNKYGSVTLPDLPGFGGMESFYRISEKPSLDNLADYLAAFVKFRYKRKKITIIAMSFGFAVVTRMLQRYPEIVNKVEVLTSVVGFARYDDFKFKKRTFWLMKFFATIFSWRLPAWCAKNLLLRPLFIKLAYRLVADRHVKLKDASVSERRERINFEVTLWQCNDIRTYMHTTLTMLKLDLCNARINLPLHHVSVEPDRYFNHRVVEQHLKVIFKGVKVAESNMKGHAPTILPDAKAASAYIPPKLRYILSKP